jgi:hypothetical protein
MNRKTRRALVRQFKHEISALLQKQEAVRQKRIARKHREPRQRVGVIANAQWFREHPEYHDPDDTSETHVGD